MNPLWPFIAVTVVALAIVLWAERTNRPTFNIIFKPIASLAFVAAAIALDALSTAVGLALFIALVLSMVGDVFLIFKESKRAFLAGIAAFWLSHVGYIVVFAMIGFATVPLAIALVVFAIIAWFIANWLRPHTKGPMKVAVPAYIAVITLMVAVAVGTTFHTTDALPVLAATTFWLSDITVARQRFVKADILNRLVGLPLYYLAQYLFVGFLV